jgi:hypothetical protein
VEPSTPPQYLAAVRRLTGLEGSRRNHVYLFRIEVTSCDDAACAVVIRVGINKFYPSNLKDLADVIRVDRAEISRVLETWTSDQLAAHLSQFPAAILDSPANLRRFVEWRGRAKLEPGSS